MRRWIDADALITDLNKGLWGKDWDKVLAEAIINETPSIDIVRCSECKHCHYEQENDVYHCYKLFHRFYDANRHFCSYGERKTDHE